jgi:hypothetical protein
MQLRIVGSNTLSIGGLLGKIVGLQELRLGCDVSDARRVPMKGLEAVS